MKVCLYTGEAGAGTSSIQMQGFNSPQATPATFAGSRGKIWNEDTVSR